MAKVSGRWIGRLVDAAGYEGSITLDLRQRRTNVRGGYEVQLVAQHGTPVSAGSVEGDLDGDQLKLRLLPSGPHDPEVEMRGDVFECLGGVGMKGVYDVSPRAYSPLLGGVVAASTEAVSRVDTVISNEER